MKAALKRSGLLSVLILALFVAIQSFAVTASWFPADDAQELAFVRGLDGWWRLFGPDAFGLFRPVKNLLFAFFAGPLGGDAVLCRSCAIALGLVSFFPVRAFFRCVTQNESLALFGAAIWLLSPTLVSSVAWLSCINIQVMCACAALAFVAHARHRPLGAALCLLAACVSYECAVAIGPALVAFDFFLRPDRLRSRRAWMTYCFYAGVTGCFLVVRHFVGATSSVNGSFVGTDRFDVALAAASFTCQHFLAWLWPFGRMAVFGGYVKGTVSPATLSLAWGVILAFLAGGLSLRKRCPVLAFGLVLALIGFLPVSNVTGIGNGPYGDYYLGLASMGLSLACVETIRRMCALRARMPRVALCVVAFLGGSRLLAIPEAARWAHLWADADRAYEETERTFPTSFHTIACRAQRACDGGRWETALSCCDRLEAIVGTNSAQSVSAQMVRALVALNGKKEASAALQALDRALATPGIVASEIRQCRFYRGCVYEDLLNDTVRAEREYAAAIPRTWTVDTVQPASRLARLHALRGDLAGAHALWDRALKLQPGNREITANLQLLRRQKNAK